MRRGLQRTLTHYAKRLSSSNSRPQIPPTDSLGLPLKPTWSVNQLLSSYPKPTITPATLKRLHELSALIPPKEGTEEHDVLKAELEDLVKLVEAVKLVEVPPDEEGIPDGRVWAEGTGIEFTDRQEDSEKDGHEAYGRELLRHAARTSNEGLYVVDADRPNS